MDAPTVLVLDGNLGFLLALAEALEKRQINAIPARTAGEAQSLLKRLQLAPDVLVLNRSDARGRDAAEKIAKQHRDAPVLRVVSEGCGMGEGAELPTAVFRKQDEVGPEQIPYLADRIEAMTRQRRMRYAGRF
jgi:ActR/RegA family two-component response regulator